MKNLISLLLGIILVGISVFIFLSHVTVTTVGFYSIGAVSTAPILVVILALLLICAIGLRKPALWLLSWVDILAMVVSIILGTKFTIVKMSAMTLILIVGLIAIGLGLVMKGFIGLSSVDPSD